MTDMPPPSSTGGVNIKYLLRALVKYKASDLHVKPGRPPLYRINGKLIPAKMKELTSDDVENIVRSILNQKQIKTLEQNLNLDCSFKVSDMGRFRCNVFYQQGNLAFVIRMIPVVVPKLENLGGLPEVLTDLALRPRGLVLITGAAGSGKSTTLAAMVQFINERRPVHILTIEDPIEFVHTDKKASITQRELGSDMHTIQDALQAGFRQDPDVIMLGEMRNLDMIRTALTAAETGHLVLSTLHTNDAKSALERIIDVFPSQEKQQVRIQLASTLLGVVSQQLLIRSDGKGRVPACEAMVKSPTIESLILRNELDRIPDAMAESSQYYKMQTWNQHLEALVSSGVVKPSEALKVSNNPEDLKLRLSGIDREEGFNLQLLDKPA